MQRTRTMAGREDGPRHVLPARPTHRDTLHASGGAHGNLQQHQLRVRDPTRATTATRPRTPAPNTTTPTRARPPPAPTPTRAARARARASRATGRTETTETRQKQAVRPRPVRPRATTTATATAATSTRAEPEQQRQRAGSRTHGHGPASAPQGYFRYTPSPLPRWEATPRRHEYFSGEYRYSYPTPVREGIYSIATDANRLTTIFSEENPNACAIV